MAIPESRHALYQPSSHPLQPTKEVNLSEPSLTEKRQSFCYPTAGPSPNQTTGKVIEKKDKGQKERKERKTGISNMAMTS